MINLTEEEIAQLVIFTTEEKANLIKMGIIMLIISSIFLLILFFWEDLEKKLTKRLNIFERKKSHT